MPKRDIFAEGAPAWRSEMGLPVTSRPDANRRILIAVGAVVLLGNTPVGAPDFVNLPKRSAVVFLGDSITWQNLYVAYIEMYVTRAFPERSFQFINLGVPGDTARHTRKRIRRDVVPLDPSLVFVMLGVNDGGLAGKSGRLLGAYARNMGLLLDDLKTETRALVVLLTPTCVEPINDESHTYNEMLGLMAERLVAIGRARGVPTIDVHTPFCNALTRASAAQPAIDLMLDPLHPNTAGHLIVAHHVLAALLPHSPPEHSHAELPVRACLGGEHTVTVAYNQRNIHIPPEARGALALVPFQARFNAHVLVIDGAQCPLRLSVEGNALGTFMPEQLAAGIDVNALNDTPWARNAEHYFRIIQNKWRWSYALWDPLGLGTRALEKVGGYSQALTDAEKRAWVQLELTRLQAEIKRESRTGAVTYEITATPCGPGSRCNTDQFGVPE